MKKGKLVDCLYCKKQFYKYKNSGKRYYCSVKCYRNNTPIYNKNKSKYKNIEERKIANLISGRKSYRKHIETRLFYYRNLAILRRGVSGKFTRKEWDNVIKKQHNKCLICGISGNIRKLTIDHIIPISKWNEWIKINNINYKCNDIQNIQALCKSCNSSKHNKIM